MSLEITYTDPVIIFFEIHVFCQFMVLMCLAVRKQK